MRLSSFSGVTDVTLSALVGAVLGCVVTFVPACTPPALVLQREALSYYRRAQTTDARVLDAHERDHLALCLASVRRASDAALATHPDAPGQIKTLRTDMERDCAGVEKLGSAPQPDLRVTADLQLADMAAPDMGAHDGGMDR